MTSVRHLSFRFVTAVMATTRWMSRCSPSHWCTNRSRSRKAFCRNMPRSSLPKAPSHYRSMRSDSPAQSQSAASYLQLVFLKGFHLFLDSVHRRRFRSMTKSVKKLMLAQKMRRSSTSSTGWTPPGQVCVNMDIIELHPWIMATFVEEILSDSESTSTGFFIEYFINDLIHN